MKAFGLGLGAALLGGAAFLAPVSGEAAPAAGAASVRTVTIALSDTGKGRWSTQGDAETGSVSMSYGWSGKLRFKVPAKAFASPTARFVARSSTTLRGNWLGESSGTKVGAPFNGPYRCRYQGKNVPGEVEAVLAPGTARGSLLLILTTRGDTGFFPPKSNGATVDCSSGYGADGPTHFEPQWLFRDTLTAQGRLTSDTAIFNLPRSALRRGTLRRAFPREVGNVNSPLRAKLAWRNVGTLVVKTA